MFPFQVLEVLHIAKTDKIIPIVSFRTVIYNRNRGARKGGGKGYLALVRWKGHGLFRAC